MNCQALAVGNSANTSVRDHDGMTIPFTAVTSGGAMVSKVVGNRRCDVTPKPAKKASKPARFTTLN